LVIVVLQVPERQPVPRTLWCFCLVLTVGAVAVWAWTGSAAAGLVQYLLAPLAWSAGRLVALLAVTRPEAARCLVLGVLGAMALQVGVATLQLAGISINTVSGAAGDTLIGMRVNGTLSHPNTLGKTAVFALVLVLPLAHHALPLIRRCVWLSAACAFVLLIVTGGRATLLGGLLLLTVWCFVSPRRAGHRGLAYAALPIGGGFAAVAVLAPRFQEDPSGGSRPLLLESAFRILPEYLTSGMGPNQYLVVMTRTDAVSAHTMLPVHNSFVLTVAELGVLAAALLFFPLLALTFRAMRRISHPGQGSAYAPVAVAMALPILLMAWTGWGMMADAMLPLWFLCAGMCSQGMWMHDRARTDGADSPPRAGRKVAGRSGAPMARVDAR
jgi:O-antigen ligase